MLTAIYIALGLCGLALAVWLGWLAVAQVRRFDEPDPHERGGFGA